MKVFFLGNIAIPSDLRNSYKNIISVLKQLGHQVEAEESLISPEDILAESLKNNEARAKQLLREMLMSDCVVFEGTKATTGGGYYLSIALQRSIPVLFLTQEEYKGLYLASSNRLLRIKQYSPTEKQALKKTIQDFFIFAEKKRLNNRFNLMISDSMNDFLNKESKANGTSKADFIRDLVYAQMDKEINRKAHEHHE